MPWFLSPFPASYRVFGRLYCRDFCQLLCRVFCRLFGRLFFSSLFVDFYVENFVEFLTDCCLDQSQNGCLCHSYCTCSQTVNMRLKRGDKPWHLLGSIYFSGHFLTKGEFLYSNMTCCPTMYGGNSL